MPLERIDGLYHRFQIALGFPKLRGKLKKSYIHDRTRFIYKKSGQSLPYPLSENVQLQGLMNLFQMHYRTLGMLGPDFGMTFFAMINSLH